MRSHASTSTPSHGHEDNAGGSVISAATLLTERPRRSRRLRRCVVRRAAVVLVVGSVVLWGYSAVASASDPVPESTWATNGSVATVTPGTGGVAYISGGFTQVAPTSGAVASFDATTGALEPAWPEVVGVVNAIAPDGSGGWFLGGLFTSVGGVPRQNLAHILADKTLDTSWTASADGQVYALAVGGSALFVGGQFATVDGQARADLAAVDTSTGALQSFAPLASAGSVTALVLSGSTLYVGGGFTTIGSAARSNLAAINTSTALATSWAPNPDGGVSALALSGSTLYVSGGFANIAGVTRAGMAAIDTATGNATAFAPPAVTWLGSAGGPVVALAVNGSAVYIGGEFDAFGGLARPGIAAADATTGQPTAWAPVVPTKCFNSNVESLLVTATTVYAGDRCLGDAQGPKTNLVAFDRTTAATTGFSVEVNDVPLALGISGSTIVAGGAFTSAGPWQPRHNFAAIDTATGAATSWNPAVSGIVQAVTVGGGSVYAATVNDTYTNTRILRIDPSSGAVTDLGLDIAGSVQALAIAGVAVYMGGQFTSVNGVARLNLASASAATGSLASWNPGAAGPFGTVVSSIVAAGTTVYVAGAFTSVGGQARTDIAGIDAITGVPTAWNPQLTSAGVPISPPSSRASLTLSGGRIYLLGGFDSVDGQARLNLASFDQTTGSLTTWNPAWRSASGQGGWLVAVGGGVAYIYEASEDGTRFVISGFDAITGARTGWQIPYVPYIPGQPFSSEGEVALNAGAVSDNMLFLAGTFTHMNGYDASGFARFATGGTSASPTAPANTIAPVVAGSPTVGATLSCSTGTWSGDPLPTFGFEWLRDDSPIAGEVATSHVVTSDDAGHTLACRVTATNTAGSTSASSPSVKVAANQKPPTVPPIKVAVVIVAKKLTAAGTLQLKVTCPAKAKRTCSGSFRLATAKAIRAKKGAKRKVVVLGRATFRVAAGKSGKAHIKLSKSARRLLARLKSVSVRLTTTTSGAGGSAAAVTITKFTLRAHR